MWEVPKFFEMVPRFRVTGQWLTPLKHALPYFTLPKLVAVGQTICGVKFTMRMRAATRLVDGR